MAPALEQLMNDVHIRFVELGTADQTGVAKPQKNLQSV